jgi:thiol-disulfide isomerase/thioredoxin
MEAIKKNLGKLMNYKYFFLILIVTIIFIIAALYTYKQYVTPRINKNYVINKEFTAGSDPTNVVEIYYFYTTWCPHCKKATPEWQGFKDQIGENEFNGYRINFLEVDCDKDTTTADKFKVKGYPTIKLVNENQIIEYDAKPNKENLMEFLKSSLPPRK